MSNHTTIGRGWNHFLLWVGVLFLSGCTTGRVEPPGDDTQALAALKQVLEAWKAGESYPTFRAAHPELIVADEDWSNGRVLREYELVDQPLAQGGHWRVQVALELAGPGESKTGNQRQRAYYAVTPGSKTSVIRSDFLE